MNSSNQPIHVDNQPILELEHHSLPSTPIMIDEIDASHQFQENDGLFSGRGPFGGIVSPQSRNYNNTVDNSDNTQEVDDDVDTRMSEPGA